MYCNLVHNGLYWPQAANNLSVTSPMLWSMPTINCSIRRLLLLMLLLLALLMLLLLLLLLLVLLMLLLLLLLVLLILLLLLQVFLGRRHYRKIF